MAAADLVILAETAAEGTSGKKYSTAAAGAISADAGFFPVVESSPGSSQDRGAAAVTGTAGAVDPAHAGT